jgi:UDP-2-acetamido-3-amino-2,3-dideoxy-glucuronate N-acetyltransferase
VTASTIHPTALIEEGVSIGEGSAIWDNVHVRHGAKIGRRCIIGEKSYIAYDVVIGDLVKINAFVYVCAGVTIGDGVMIAAGTVFTNDRFPRAASPDGGELLTSDPTEQTLATVVCRGVTIGANATIGPGIELGDFSMVGMGAVVTRSVLPLQLVVGCPARPAGWVCMCGHPLTIARKRHAACAACDRTYRLRRGRPLLASA